jgi:alkylation response protein AidB-like acyl-CoA dehydrogenase
MDCHGTAEERVFREEVRDWLRANKPDEVRPEGADFAGQKAFDLAWQRTMFEAGWAGVSWPKEYGGRGLSATQQLIWYEEYAAAGAPANSGNCTWLGINHAGPTLMHMGTEAQKAFHLPKILSGETAWCQGFSEPNAGSDLASLRTRAEIDGDDLVVNGQKIWTSYAHLTDYQELLVRTGSPEGRHRGLTWAIGDMHAPGVEIRPILALDGRYHNCEVFYDNVRIPLSNVVGEVGEGWSTAMTTFKFERGSAMFSTLCEFAVSLEQLIDYARTHPGLSASRTAVEDSSVAERLGEFRARLQSIRALIYMLNSADEQGVDLGPEGAILMLPFSELVQQILRFGLEVYGPKGLSRHRSTQWIEDYFTAFSITIAGGSSEIQRNVVGERLLGLPR